MVEPVAGLPLVALSEPGEPAGGAAIRLEEGFEPGVDVVTVDPPGAPDPAAGGAEVVAGEGAPPVGGREMPLSPEPEAGGEDVAPCVGVALVEGVEIAPDVLEDEVEADVPPEAEPPPEDDALDPVCPWAAIGKAIPARSTMAQVVGRMIPPP